jgi:hypothetical protein
LSRFIIIRIIIIAVLALEFLFVTDLLLEEVVLALEVLNAIEAHSDELHNVFTVKLLDYDIDEDFSFKFGQSEGHCNSQDVF